MFKAIMIGGTGATGRQLLKNLLNNNKCDQITTIGRNSSFNNQEHSKLKDIRATLNEKHKAHSDMINFFETNEDCPTCEQHIDETFKEGMIVSKKSDIEELSVGMGRLKKELASVAARSDEIKGITNNIRSNSIKLATINQSITELEKFNTKLKTEIEQFTKDGCWTIRY